jgi:hypothetical protein
VETPKVETPKVETPKVETPKVETPKVETPKKVLHIAKTDKKKVKRTKKEKKTKKIVISSKNRKLQWRQLDSETLHPHEIQQIQQSDTLNKFAYKYSIHKGSYITIISHKKSIAQRLKKYLIAHGVPKQDIKIMQKNIKTTRLILTGRK